MLTDAKFLREETLALNSVSLNARKGSANQGSGCCVAGYIMNETLNASYSVAL